VFPRLGGSRVGTSGYGYHGKGASDLSRSDPEHGGQAGVPRSEKTGLDSLPDSKYERSHNRSREDVQYDGYKLDNKAVSPASNGGGVGPVGLGLNPHRPRNTIKVNEGNIGHVGESGSDQSEMFGMQPLQTRQGPYLQTDITFAGREAMKSPGKIKVEYDILQVTSSTSGGRRMENMI
jgi:hypothetical protein